MREPWIVVSATRAGSLAGTLTWAQRITPHDRVFVVASSRTAENVTMQLALYPTIRLVVQPRDLGTAMELLHPLAHVLERDPLNHVMFVQHHTTRPVAVAEALESAEYTIARDQVTLLAASPADWIPGRDPFVAAAFVTTFWDQARSNLPVHARMLERYIAAIGTPAEDIALRGVYAQLEPASFGRELLANAHTIAVVPLDRKPLQLRVLALSRAA